MSNIIFSAPINSLSFGNVSYNILRELFELDMDVAFFPVGKDLDFSAFDKATDEFKDWVKSSYHNRFDYTDRSTPHLKMWHINGSESSITGNNFLYTFHETSESTKIENKICSLHKKVIFSSSYSKDIFSKSCDNVTNVPIGLDKDFHITDKEYLKGKIHFGLMGKFEKRKHTARILSHWAERFGDNNDYQLTCCINNSFLDEDENYKNILDALNKKRYKNINILPRLNTNSEVNEYLNSIDIDLSGLSGAEGWNLPAFNSTCLGKWSIVLNSTAHKDWADESNCILVEPDGQEDCYDGLFFKEGLNYNQGQIHSFTKESFNNAIDKALDLYKDKNKNGIDLSEKFTYNNTVKEILKIIKL
jgi:hypothetical protein